MTKVLLVGDTHGDNSFVAGVLRCARDQAVEVVIQLGDFGYDFNRNLIASISAWLDRDPEHKFYWVDGNHDQHDFLEQVVCADEHALDAPVNMGGMQYNNVTFPDRLFYVPRGAVFQVGACRVMGVGGAFSIDKAYRKAHVSWWPQETIRSDDMVRAMSRGKVDVIVSHDGPSSEHLEQWLSTYGYKVDIASWKNRQDLSRIVDEARPQHLYHGHYHRRYNATYTSPDGWETRVHGIGANVGVRGQIDSTPIFGENYIVESW